MARTFNGRGSEELLNKELHSLYEVMENIISTPDDPAIGPATDKEGALWLDRSGDGDLKYMDNGEWKLISQDKLKMICEILNPEEPNNPVPGQLWLQEGTLMYYSGIEWTPVKAMNVDSDFSISAFEQFLMINPVPAAGKLVVDNNNSNAAQIERLYAEEEFLVTDVLTTYTLKTGTFYLDSNSVNVYIDGKKVPKSCYEEIDDTTIRINSYRGNTTSSIDDKILVCIEYLRKEAYDSVDYTNPNTMEPSDLNTQFLLPSVYHDRFFINGLHTHDYKEISSVAIEYPADHLQGKVASAIHVNPDMLSNIKKRFFKIDKNDPTIYISEKDTEFYGIVDGIGKLLLKGIDYKSTNNGIKLTDEAIDSYKYVQTVAYTFKPSKTKGKLFKGIVPLTETTSIYIGDIDSPLSVFIQGLYLAENPETYIYEDGFLKLKMETKMDIDIIAFPKKEVGNFITVSDNVGTINVQGTFKHKLVFVYGLNLEVALADYTVDEDDPSILLVKNVMPGMSYAIVELETDDMNMWDTAGVVSKDEISGLTYIPFEDGKYNELSNVIVFVNGLLMSKDDISIDSSNNRINITGGFGKDSEYVLLEDVEGRYVFSNRVNFNTIPLKDRSDVTLVYIENQLVTDANAVKVSILPKKAYPGEVVQLITPLGFDWYIYKNTWEKITSTEDIDTLNNVAVSYYSDAYCIDILKNFGKRDCVYYSYQYGNSVDSPLYRGVIRTIEGKTEYKVAFSHIYPSNKNCLSIWQNGLRQYPKMTPDSIGYEELGNGSFCIPEGIDGSLFYVIERPEKHEERACERTILTIDDIVDGTDNVFNCNLSLTAANVTVYISGLKQPNNAFEILSANTIKLKGTPLCYPSNYPSESIYVDTNYTELLREHPDSILIETRNDATLKQLTIQSRYAGQNEFFVEECNSTDPSIGGDSLPTSLIDSKDFINIFVNGLAYGKDYKVDQERQCIVLTNQSFIDSIGGDPIYEYFQKNPVEYEQWRKDNGGIEYQNKNKKDIITFEWR